MRRSALLATGMFTLSGLLGLGLPGCGGIVGDGVFLADGPAFWGIPFVPTTGGRSLVVGLKNLDDDDAGVTLTGHKPDGTAYGAPFVVTLAGFGERRFAASLIKSAAPAGGWIEVSTPTKRVEVYFLLTEPGAIAEEASRASALPDLLVPPPVTTGAVAVNGETDFVQVSNASALVNTIAVKAFDEPADPSLPPVETTPAAIVLAPFATTILSADVISGIAGFFGSFELESPDPFFVAAIEEDGSFTVDVPRAQDLLQTKVAALEFGHETFGGLFEDYLDFAMVVKNDTDEGRALTVNRVTLPDGFNLIAAPRTLFFAPHETRVFSTTDAPFDDVYGDVLLTFGLSRTNVELLVPDGVDVTFRQFDPQFLGYSTTVRPTSGGHLYAVLDVLPVDVLPSDVRTYVTILNPGAFPIDVRIDVHVPEPVGFDVTPRTLTTVTVPAHGSERFSPDGVEYLDRDLSAVPFIGLLLQSPSSFSVNGRREGRSPSGPLVFLTPTVTRNYDVFD